MAKKAKKLPTFKKFKKMKDAEEWLKKNEGGLKELGCSGRVYKDGRIVLMHFAHEEM